MSPNTGKRILSQKERKAGPLSYVVVLENRIPLIHATCGFDCTANFKESSTSLISRMKKIYAKFFVLLQ